MVGKQHSTKQPNRVEQEQTKNGKSSAQQRPSLFKRAAPIVLAFTLFLIIDHITRPYLFDLSIKHTMELRTKHRTKFYDLVSVVISELGDKYVVGLLIFLSYHFLDNTKAFIVVLVSVMSQSFSCALKSIFHEARPFFVADYVPNGCRFEYGNPSGHSFIATGLYLAIWDFACRQYKVGGFLKYGTLVIIINNALILGASRIYNGVHTYNQVTQGYAWGLFTYYGLCHVLYDEIKEFVISLKNRNVQQLLWNPMIKVFILANVLPIILYFYNKKYNPIPPEWGYHIEKNCHNKELTNVDVELQNFIHFQFSWAFVGAYLGLIYDDRKDSQTREFSRFYDTSLWVTIKRMMVCGPFAAVTQLPILLIPKSSHFLIIMVFKTMLPSCIATLYIFGFNKAIAHRFGLISTQRDSDEKIDAKAQKQKVN